MINISLNINLYCEVGPCSEGATVCLMTKLTRRQRGRVASGGPPRTLNANFPPYTEYCQFLMGQRSGNPSSGIQEVASKQCDVPVHVPVKAPDWSRVTDPDGQVSPEAMASDS